MIKINKTMYRTLKRVSVLKRILDENVVVTPNIVNGIETIRTYSGRKEKAKQNAEIEKVMPFNEMLSDRHEEAGRSILVQVQSEQSCADLYEYCNERGRVRTMMHYHTPKQTHFVLVEMDDAGSLKEILNRASHPNNAEVVPVHSQLLWFKANEKGRPPPKNSEVPAGMFNVNVPLSVSATVNSYLASAVSISQQMALLYKNARINELGTRLRFLTARQIESGLQGLFPNLRVYPFGSSVNGFGRNGCDLDLVILLPGSSSSSADSRLVYHAKSAGDDRIQTQSHLEVVADLMQLFMPGCVAVKRILHARVPIIKYRHELTQLECDVSLYNKTCLAMTDLLYVLGVVDERVRPLVFSIRCWAKAAGITNPNPGRWITNFTLTLLVVFFLQQPCGNLRPVLPPLGKLFRSKDAIMTTKEFASGLILMRAHLEKNDASMESLLSHFFQFYSEFDFAEHALNVVRGKIMTKPDHSALYIVNPVETELNVSKNVSLEELERFRQEARNAVWLLENFEPGQESWGLSKLLEIQTPSYGHHQMHRNSKSRLVDVKMLFDR